ncbi:MAG: hypothetical protein IPL79_00055 [Myxococcales bacterium]|nr:hypothetical protein [Myxococcales bacterium]
MAASTWVSAGLAMFLVAGCGKSSGLTTDDLPFSSATRVRPEAAGAHCEAGGQAIETGLDSNRNGAPDTRTAR